MEELAEHYDEVSRLGRTEIAGSIPSYWGPTQTRRAYYPGIESVTTAGHGGFIVSPELNELVDPEWRNDAGNYEEDSCWAIVDRKSVAEGKSVSVSVDLGGSRIIKKKKK